MSFIARVAVLPLFASLALSMTHDIKVGSKGLVYDPEEVKASKGDVLRFSFYPKEHNVAQGVFEQPCKPFKGGIYSGDMPVSSGVGMMTFDVTVNDTEPIWFYCSESTHCKSGMAMVVNAASDKTLADYKKGALVADSEDPEAVNGGVFMTASGTGAGASATSAASSASKVAASASSVASSAASKTATGMAEVLRVNPGWMAALGMGGVAVAGLV